MGNDGLGRVRRVGRVQAFMMMNIPSKKKAEPTARTVMIVTEICLCVVVGEPEDWLAAAVLEGNTEEKDMIDTVDSECGAEADEA